MHRNLSATQTSLPGLGEHKHGIIIVETLKIFIGYLTFALDAHRCKYQLMYNLY